jgi:hypothetical protein
MRSIVIGLGETGHPLWEVLDKAYPKRIVGYDVKYQTPDIQSDEKFKFLHICIPYGQRFIEIVQEYQKKLNPGLTVIHSTVPVGTTRKIENAVHSPILGKHGRMSEDILTYPKWIGGEKAREVVDFFEGARMRTNVVNTPEETELLKLLCLAKYGMSIAFSIYQKRLCEQFRIDYNDVYLWDTFYNEGVLPSLKRPLITPPSKEKIGGHCVVPGTKLLNAQFPNPILDEVLKYE